MLLKKENVLHQESLSVLHTSFDEVNNPVRVQAVEMVIALMVRAASRCLSVKHLEAFRDIRLRMTMLPSRSLTRVHGMGFSLIRFDNSGMENLLNQCISC